MYNALVYPAEIVLSTTQHSAPENYNGIKAQWQTIPPGIYCLHQVSLSLRFGRQDVIPASFLYETPLNRTERYHVGDDTDGR